MPTKSEKLKSLLTSFITTLDKIGHPEAMIDLADIKIMPDGKIQIDPSWTRGGGTALVEAIITKPKMLGLQEGKDFSAQRHTVRSDKFIIEPENFDKWISVIEEKQNILQKKRDRITTSTAEQMQHRQVEHEQKTLNASSILPAPVSKRYISDRTPPLSDDQVKRIQIPEWKVQKETLNSSVTRFVQSDSKDAYIDIDKRANKISSNSTSVKAFMGIIKAFQCLYAKKNLLVITLSGSANNEQSRNNCKAALESSGYDASQVKEIMSPLIAVALPSAAAPEADQSSSNKAPRPR